MRRPITDYYDPRGSGRWAHVPYFALGAHNCPASPDRKVGRHFTSLPIDPDVQAYRERVTHVAREEMAARAREEMAARAREDMAARARPSRSSRKVN